jgi:hypothetical protein
MHRTNEKTLLFGETTERKTQQKELKLTFFYGVVERVP